MIPSTPPPPPAAAVAAPMTAGTIGRAAAWEEYVVAAGDTLWALARSRDITVTELVAHNNLPSAGVRLHVGDRLRLPVPPPPAAPPRIITPDPAALPAADRPGRQINAAPPAEPDESDHHLVRVGDNLWEIAHRTGLSVEALAAVNGLTPTSTIVPGQRLRLPHPHHAPLATPPAPSTSTVTSVGRGGGPAYGTYVVRPGDTAWSIATALGINVRDLLATNDLPAHHVLLPGKRLDLPGGRLAARQATKKERTRAADTGSVTITVQDGDTLSAIAVRFGVTLTRLAKTNGIGIADDIYPGQTLRVVGSVASSAASPTARTALSDAAAINLAYLNQVPTPDRTQIRDMIITTARAHGVDPRLALAISWQESRWAHNAVSQNNAIGAMQCLPSTARWASALLDDELNLLDAQDNITCGVVVLRSLIRSADSESQAIAGYYQGLASVRSDGMYVDTAAYVASVLDHKKRM
ncbi:Cell division suppressor protein YneA [Austwickia sp. TVS 96-490-7B]|uniref:LysM peptidoglycan-binding domain-containing protein n=1 Tax=Austwickia sp. TVS 96-490-7B TaxID=2830843 RepID=UPI001C5611B7|nr:LysM peptidoglycan-binding domain-containing protein [Austwickia sp. TVS 96-490-7B]MBW3086114.1 Cell division suppressor protein YneA [Austwickia sp. TVS 96-490-7B]